MNIHLIKSSEMLAIQNQQSLIESKFLKESLVKHMSNIVPKTQREMDKNKEVLSQLDSLIEKFSPKVVEAKDGGSPNPSCSYAMNQLLLAQIAVMLACEP